MALDSLWMRISRSWRRCCGVVNALTASRCPMFFFVAEGTTTSARARLRLLLSAFALCEDRDEGDQEKTALETKYRKGGGSRERKQVRKPTTHRRHLLLHFASAQYLVRRSWAPQFPRGELFFLLSLFLQTLSG